jgi:DNA polymerase-3 subunit gamma/tau
MDMQPVQSVPAPTSLAEVVALFAECREAKLATYLKRSIRLVRFSQGLLEFSPERSAPPDLAGQVGKLLTQWTGQRWVVSVVTEPGESPLHDQELAQAKSDPLIKSILDAFPGATIESVRRSEDG